MEQVLKKQDIMVQELMGKKKEKEYIYILMVVGMKDILRMIKRRAWHFLLYKWR